MSTKIQLIECPRDAIQGLKHFIPTEKKAAYINYLLSLNLFECIDFGSFVSPKAMPQMADTAMLMKLLKPHQSSSKLLSIIANERGAQDACQFEEISLLGYPFSISETFQLRNTNATIAQSLERVKNIQDICLKHQKKLVIYISMAFGNPYGDVWNADIAIEWVEKLQNLGIRYFALSDTIGVATPQIIRYLFENLIPQFPDAIIGSHFHTSADSWEEKVEAAWQVGCTRFDGAMLGYGGCPMAKDDLVGNMPTEKLLQKFNLTDIGTIENLKNHFNLLIR